MNIFKISCYGDGSYFTSYLQSVTVIADTKEKAIELVKKWLKDNSEDFVREEKHWNIDLVVENISNNCVIDYYMDSDY